MTLDDRELERIARGLGGRAAARLDVERTSEAVLARLRAARSAPSWGVPAFLRAAAAVALVVASSMFVYRSGQHHGGESWALLPPVQLQELSDEELAEVLDSLTVDVHSQALTNVGLSDLDERQLTELLQLMEG